MTQATANRRSKYKINQIEVESKKISRSVWHRHLIFWLKNQNESKHWLRRLASAESADEKQLN